MKKLRKGFKARSIRAYELLDQYLRSGQIERLNEAIGMFEPLVSEAQARRREHEVYLSTLSFALLQRFESTRDPADLLRAVLAAERAIDAADLYRRLADVRALVQSREQISTTEPP